ncbi:hypothetical protein FRC11_012741 [Ceratobasidium sp. 423]|nr:hypothetical protein FRC11_012741 [Ceratobasidium sp. 423]
MAPQTQALKLSSATRGSTRNLPNVGEKHTPSSLGKYVLVRPAYPTPESTDHKSIPHPQPSKSCANHGLSLDFEASSALQSGIQAVINLDSSDSDDASEAMVLPSKSRAKRKNGGGEGHGIEQGDQGGRKGSRGGGRGRRGGQQSKSKADAEDEDGGAAGETPVAGPSKQGGKGSRGGGRGSRGGGRGGRGGRQAKSKAIIEDAEDGDEEPAEDMPIAGPSNQQPGNRKIPRIKCKVRGE